MNLNKVKYTITSPIEIDGKEIAKVTARYVGEQMKTVKTFEVDGKNYRWEMTVWQSILIVIAECVLAAGVLVIPAVMLAILEVML